MSSVLPVTDLLAVLRAHALLEPEQLEELERLPGASSQALAQRAMERGWLTPFQVNRILTGKVKELLFGQYLLQAKLGEGGMGQVFRALDRTMHRVVALKLIRPEVLDNPHAVERFLKEIRAVASLRHPNIVLAYHAGQAEDTHFLVMEYVEGKDLARLVTERHPLPVNSVCDWGRQAALALQHVSEKGLVHRDVKPSNLLLSTSGDVKLLDLGLVRVRALGSATGDGSSTRHGTMMGTPDYLAPEQIADAAGVDIRADIYSLGCTLYHLLAGRPPFPGDDLATKIRSHLAVEAPLVEHLRPDVPAGLGEIVHRMMRKERAERYQSPGDVGAALTAFAAPAGGSVEASVLSSLANVPPSLPPTGSAILRPTMSALAALTTPEWKPRPGRKHWVAASLVVLVVVAWLLWKFLPGQTGSVRFLDKP